MSREVQSKRSDKKIINFPILSSQDIDYEYVYAYLKDWVSKKYRAGHGIIINRVGDNYECETIQGALMSNILDMIFEDYKELLLDSLERESVDSKGKVGGIEPVDVLEGKREVPFERLQGKQSKGFKKGKITIA
ncbi:hypothetical protein bcCo53_001396 (plasmid) [Borrelia coriaceae]|uniref:hypothetical protein n=1 Tax=Borrelia coriaceae TaxID=144 RepID=UPI001FF4FB1D|nr:hypothetical protein [Borrelia coriaceae]UPA17218.1 hypothetical protein bcCo53_001396 [Borrelia coriaceae]